MLFLCLTAVSGIAQTEKARGVDTQCTAFPCVVASIALTGQTDSSAHVPLITPAADGLFQLSYYFEVFGVPGSRWSVGFDWMDDQQHRDTGLELVIAGSYSANVFIIRQVAGKPITYSAVTGSLNRPGNYNLFVTVVQLQ